MKLNAKGQPVAGEGQFSARLDRRVYCEARTEKSQRAGGWGAANEGCGNLAVTLVDGHAACAAHRAWDRGWR